MIWLLAGGFLLAVALIAGLFLIDKNSMKSVSTNPGFKPPKPREEKQEISLNLSGDIVQKLNRHIQDGKYEIVDQVTDQLEQFPREKQALIRQVLSQPSVTERYKAGLNDTKYKVRAASAERLGKTGGDGAAALLFHAMADRNEEVRLAAAASLKKVKDPSVAPMLIEALKFPNKWLPARVAEVLLSLGEVSVTALEGALSDDDPVIRGYVVELLGELGQGVSAPALYPTLKDENSNVRLQAARVLGKLSSSESVGPLVELLNDRETKVKVQAVRSIGKIGGAEAVKQLERVLVSEEDPLIHIAALDSLKIMGREGLGVIKKVSLSEGHPLREKAGSFLADCMEDTNVKVSYM